MDNDELSPWQVDDVKDFIDDYVEKNQEDFDEFDDVDMLYETLSLDNVEAPGFVKFQVMKIDNGRLHFC
ncbi:hypothetical protein L2E82_15946 [Cichorium intybus]|uniref:Uncharacterized protein n=1 Tax=Cichorium intybus TaxID=13427 RepID=A0ACB9F463_CICIN|nr:hypothetical protein L2E82_15946 [Cichorium intybus]